jgi:hypothetical protein
MTALRSGKQIQKKKEKEKKSNKKPNPGSNKVAAYMRSKCNVNFKRNKREKTQLM